MQQALSQRLLACLLLSTAAPTTGETVVLRNGYRLHAEHYETGPHCIRLRTSNGGWIALQASSVLRIEPDPASQPAGTAEDVPSAEPGEPALQPDAIEQFSREAGLPEALVRAVVWAESGFQPDAVSPKGAVGLMQLMPATAAELGVDPQISSENLRGGIRYLKQMLERFAGREDQLVRALAAYNAGPGRVALHDGLPPYPETIAYVERILSRYLALSDPQGRDASRIGPMAPQELQRAH